MKSVSNIKLGDRFRKTILNENNIIRPINKMNEWSPLIEFE